MNSEYQIKLLEQIEKDHLADRKKIRTLVSAVRRLQKRIKVLEDRPVGGYYDSRPQ